MRCIGLAWLPVPCLGQVSFELLTGRVDGLADVAFVGFGRCGRVLPVGSNPQGGWAQDPLGW